MAEYPALDRLEKVASEMAARAQEMEELTERVNQIEATIEEADGTVQITAGAGGHITRVDLDPRAMRMSSEELGQAITRGCQKAVEVYEERATEALSGLMGQGSEIGNFLQRNVEERPKRQTAPEPEPEAGPGPAETGAPRQFVFGQDPDNDPW